MIPLLKSMMLGNRGGGALIPESTGPGPSEIIAGNTNEGYFGTLTSEEFLTGDDLANHFRLTEGYSFNSDTDWLKFYLDGTVLFIPVKPIRYALSWTTLYHRGLVYGENITGLHTIGAGFPQNGIINIQGSNFRVRLIRGSDLDPYQGALDTGNNHDGKTIGSEWNRLFYNIIQQNEEEEKWASFTQSDLGIGSSTARGTLCMESIDGDINSKLVRGFYGIHNSSSIGYQASNSNIGWRPVLELLDEIVPPIFIGGNYFDPDRFSEEVLFLAPKYLEGAYIPDPSDKFSEELLFLRPKYLEGAYIPDPSEKFTEELMFLRPKYLEGVFIPDPVNILGN